MGEALWIVQQWMDAIGRLKRRHPLQRGLSVITDEQLDNAAAAVTRDARKALAEGETP